MHNRCKKDAREGTRGTREGHERCPNMALNGNGYFSFWHTWDTVGTRGRWRQRYIRSARERHESGTRVAREWHESGTRVALEVHEMKTAIFHFCTLGTRLGHGWDTADRRRRKLVLYCFQEKEIGALQLFSRRRTLVYYCSQGDVNWCTTVLRRRKQVLYCFRIREHVHYCYQEKATGALLF